MTFLLKKTAKEPPFGDPFVVIGTVNSGGKRSRCRNQVQGERNAVLARALPNRSLDYANSVVPHKQHASVSVVVEVA